MKYAKSENVKIVLSLLKQHNIKHVVISPGGTNIPLTQGFQSDDFFICHSVVDERSAMYFAIGLYLELGQPIATTCTSAQATRNYLPGLTEAFYKHVPILAITCSKHPRHTYQEFMQAPDQTSLPKDAVKMSYSLPHVVTNEDRLFAIRVVNEAILELSHHLSGPVQLNVPIVDSERLSFEDIELPIVRKIERLERSDFYGISIEGKRIMIVAGEHHAYTEEEINLINDFLKHYNAFVYVNHLSNIKTEKNIAGNLALSSMTQQFFDNELCPEILITIGGQTGDYALFGKLNNSSVSFEHWRVCCNGDVVDTYDHLTKIFECSFTDFFGSFITSHNNDSDASYYLKWLNIVNNYKLDIELPLSNIYVAQQLCNLLPKYCNLNLAILNSLRSWSFFPINDTIKCFSPVAAFGIDGAMSMTIGQSVVSDNLCFLVTGDLAFFYDMNSLGIREIRNNVRILCINNGRGSEFTVYGKLDIDYDSYISAANHYHTASGWIKDCGFIYRRASTKDELFNCLNEFVSPSEKPIVLEVITCSDNETKALSLIIDANKVGTTNENLKQQVKKILGSKLVGALRKLK